MELPRLEVEVAEMKQLIRINTCVRCDVRDFIVENVVCWKDTCVLVVVQYLL